MLDDVKGNSLHLEDIVENLNKVLEKWLLCTIVTLLWDLTVTEWTDPTLLGLSNPQKWSTNQTAGFIRCLSVTLYPM